MFLLSVDNDKTQNEKGLQCLSRQMQNAGQHQPSPYKNTAKLFISGMQSCEIYNI
jgi:hypothetical protein